MYHCGVGLPRLCRARRGGHALLFNGRKIDSFHSDRLRPIIMSVDHSGDNDAGIEATAFLNVIDYSVETIAWHRQQKQAHLKPANLRCKTTYCYQSVLRRMEQLQNNKKIEFPLISAMGTRSIDILDMTILYNCKW